jgi:hypothetical protein
MYGLPEDTDLTAFVGRELELVSIGSYVANISFSGFEKIGITIEGDYAVSKPGGAQTRYSAAPEGAGELVALLGSSVTDVQISEHGTTTIYFADGAAIAIYDSEAHYESYQIYIGEREIVV